MPLFIIFFRGILIYLLKAILYYFLGINIEWISITKELEATGFFIRIDKIFKNFKYIYIIILLIIRGLIYLVLFVLKG